MSPGTIDSPERYRQVIQDRGFFDRKLREHDASARPADVDPRFWTAYRESLESLVQQWTEAMHEWTGAAPPNHFRCAACGEEYEKPEGSEEMAEVERLRKYPDTPKEEMAVVCDDCHEMIEAHFARLESA